MELTSNRSLGLSSSRRGAGEGGGLLTDSETLAERVGGGGGVCSRARASLGSKSGGAEHWDAARPTSSSVSVRSLSVPTAM